MTQTVLALYDSSQAAQDTVADLVNSGFRRDEISFVAGDHRSNAGRRLRPDRGGSPGVGAALGGLGGLLVGLGTMAIPGIGPIIAAGPLAATLAGASAGAIGGGLAGALEDAGVPRQAALNYAEGLRRGGSLVIARVGENMAGPARGIMERHGAADIEARAQEWREAGWIPPDENGEYSDPVADAENQERPAGYGTSPLQIDEQIGPAASEQGAAYGGAEYLAGERTGATYNDNPDLRTERHAPADAASQERGEGYSSGAGQTGAGFQGGERPRPGLVSARDYDSFDQGFRSHHQLVYGETQGFERYEPAYRFGYDLAGDERYRNPRWSDVEPKARRAWEERYPNEPWDNFSAAVRHAWERATAQGQAGSDPGTPGEPRPGQDARAQRPSYQGPDDRRI